MAVSGREEDLMGLSRSHLVAIDVVVVTISVVLFLVLVYSGSAPNDAGSGEVFIPSPAIID